MLSFCGITLFRTLWRQFAELRQDFRIAVKVILFCSIVLFILFPNPFLLVKQVQRYLAPQSLIQTDFPGISRINQEIDALLPEEATRREEFAVIQNYVLQHIRYEYDWNNWGNIDFWPTAQEVWKRKQEDCDGRAILAVSILRSRRFRDAALTGNMRHVWVTVGQTGLMGPDDEQNITREDGKTRILLPSAEMLLSATALFFDVFPAIRNVMILLTLLCLVYHPATNPAGLWGTTSLSLLGFVLIREWARSSMNSRIFAVDMYFISGIGLMIGAVVLAAIISSRATHQGKSTLERMFAYITTPHPAAKHR